MTVHVYACARAEWLTSMGAYAVKATYCCCLRSRLEAGRSTETRDKHSEKFRTPAASESRWKPEVFSSNNIMTCLNLVS